MQLIAPRRRGGLALFGAAVAFASALGMALTGAPANAAAGAAGVSKTSGTVSPAGIITPRTYRWQNDNTTSRLCLAYDPESRGAARQEGCDLPPNGDNTILGAENGVICAFNGKDETGIGVVIVTGTLKLKAGCVDSPIVPVDNVDDETNEQIGVEDGTCAHPGAIVQTDRPGDRFQQPASRRRVCAPLPVLSLRMQSRMPVPGENRHHLVRR